MVARPKSLAAALRLAAIVLVTSTSCSRQIPSARPTNPDDLQQSIVRANLDRPGDPELVSRYAGINRDHFQGLLPAIAVRWESRLAEVDAQEQDNLKLLGTFGRIGGRSVILLNPSLKSDDDDLARALSHEMVHAYLSTTLGDQDVKHSSSYQAVLRRLALEGAFKGIPSTEGEREQLRVWLDQERPKIDSEPAVAAFNREVERYNLMLVYPNGVDKK